MERLAFFSPKLTLKNVLAGIEFYKKAFDAIEKRRWSNPDDSVHVVEMTIGGAMFHLHEEVSRDNQLSYEDLKTPTSLIGMFVSDPDKVVKKAAEAGAIVTSQVQDFDYGYRQGVIADPFGHQWLIQRKI